MNTHTIARNIAEDPNAAPYRLCVRCVMDTSDPEIEFDDAGVCNHCRTAEAYRGVKWFPEGGEERLASVVEQIKAAGRGKPYDCLIGLSGGVDSTYLAYLVVKEFGLRPLALHVDAGWNSEIAVHNIEQTVRRLDIDLETVVIDWPTIRDLQVAYLRAGVPNQDVPQDHSFVAALLRTAAAHKIKYFLSGSNLASESILPISWGYDNNDAINIKAIHARFGSGSLAKFNMLSFYDYYVHMPFIARVKLARPLNLLNYDYNKAKDVITKELGWRSYGAKHHESRWTKYFQNFYLPSKFGFDKRRAHYSSLIVSGQMTRAEALAALEKPLFDPETIELDQEFVMKKLGLSHNEFLDALNAPARRHEDFPNWGRLSRLKERLKRLTGIRGTL